MLEHSTAHYHQAYGSYRQNTFLMYISVKHLQTFVCDSDVLQHCSANICFRKLFEVRAKNKIRMRNKGMQWVSGASSWKLDSPHWCLRLFSSSLMPVRSPWLGLGDQEVLGPTFCSWRWQLVFSPEGRNKRQVFIFRHSTVINTVHEVTKRTMQHLENMPRVCQSSWGILK